MYFPILSYALSDSQTYWELKDIFVDALNVARSSYINNRNISYFHNAAGHWQTWITLACACIPLAKLKKSTYN